MRSADLPLADPGIGRSLAIIGALYAVCMLATAVLAGAVGSPFVLWFRDTPLILGAMLILIVLMGIFWDGGLISLALITQTVWRKFASTPPPLTVEAMRARRFFTCGPGPTVMLLATAITILGTSNITLVNLELLGEGTRWRDPFFWQLEGAFLQKIAALPIDTAAWDRLYHSAWGIELLAAFALVVIGRGPRIVLHYCTSMIILFYVGRMLGVLNPVMGPAFHQPDVFAYLDGSATGEAMRLVASVMAAPAEQAVDSGGILLGGVSAMPSLHVAMVAVTAYWLWRAAHWTALVTVPWVLLVWTSTVLLGWHYALDGAGGIVLAAASAWLASHLLQAAGTGMNRSAGTPRKAAVSGPDPIYPGGSAGALSIRQSRQP